jgi:hypothetical protein
MRHGVLTTDFHQKESEWIESTTSATRRARHMPWRLSGESKEF